MKPVVTISSLILSFDTNRPNHFQIRQTHKKIFHAVLPRNAHAVVDGACKQLGHTGAILNKFYGSVVGNCQRVTTTGLLKQFTIKNIAAYVYKGYSTK